MSTGSNDGSLEILHIGNDELVIRQRYTVLSILNDILVGLWFVIGSVFFFYESLTYVGTWFFVIGSIELLIRPIIRLSRQVHLKRINPEAAGTEESGYDF